MDFASVEHKTEYNNNNNNGRNGSCLNVAGYLIRGEAQIADN